MNTQKSLSTVSREIVGRRIAKRLATAFLVSAIALSAPASLAATPPEERVIVKRPLDKAAIENLQRWVNAGHELWCRDARMVAADELRRVAPGFSGDLGQLEVPLLDGEIATPDKAVFAWTPIDGEATYRVTVERYAWLLPAAGQREKIVWVPTSTEIVTHP